METSAHALLSRWETFYFLVGSSGAALTGLMFIVITLVMDTRLPRSLDTVNAFATPNVLHFAVVFLLSAVLTAPWQGDRSPAHVLGAIALAGVVYVLIVLRRMRRQEATSQCWRIGPGICFFRWPHMRCCSWVPQGSRMTRNGRCF